MSSLSGKTALVTGASRGIGRASAIALARMGAQVLAHYSTGEGEARAVSLRSARLADVPIPFRRTFLHRTGRTSSPSRSGP
jgi:NAD(P)-dependent dehydrogenase (short-subunit alcohol dehydrogenase family)